MSVGVQVDETESCESKEVCPLGTPRDAYAIVAEVARATKDVQDIRKAIHGNGRDGLLADVARLKLYVAIIIGEASIVLALVVKLLLD